MSDYAAARRHMVDGQILPNNVREDRLIEALLDIPRELFVPKARRGVAYVDEDLEIAPGRYLMEPMVFARMLQAADIREDDVVLVVGAGLGYEVAVAARLGAVVVALEEDEDLAAKAVENLNECGIDNAAVVTDALAGGCPKQAPFDAIFLGGAVSQIPQALIEQLAEGGRLVGVVNRRNIGSATLVTKTGGVIGDRVLFDAGIPFLPGFEPKPAFQF